MGAPAPTILGWQNEVLPFTLTVPLGAPTAVGLVLPGAAYTQDRPLLATTRESFAAAGAELILSGRYYGLDSKLSMLTGDDREACISIDSGAFGRAAFERAAGKPILLAGKSIGTSALAHALKQVPDLAKWPAAWLTPLWKDQMVYDAIAAQGARAYVLIGMADPQYDPEIAEKLRKKKVEVVAVEGADHGMTVANDATATAKVLVDLKARLAALVAMAMGTVAPR